MLETKIKLLEDRPDRIVINESLRPWQWGGLAFSPVQVVLALLFPFILFVKGTRKVVFDKAHQNVIIYSRILFSRSRKQIQFSEVESIVLSHRRVTRVVGNTSPSRQTVRDLSMPLSLNLGELSLTLSDKSSLKIVTTYWSDKEIRKLGSKVSELLGKPFAEDCGKSGQ